MPPLNGPAWSVERDTLVVLLRMAADTSGEPLADGEVRLLRTLCDTIGINPELAGINLGCQFCKGTGVLEEGIPSDDPEPPDCTHCGGTGR